MLFHFQFHLKLQLLREVPPHYLRLIPALMGIPVPLAALPLLMALLQTARRAQVGPAALVLAAEHRLVHHWVMAIMAALKAAAVAVGAVTAVQALHLAVRITAAAAAVPAVTADQHRFMQAAAAAALQLGVPKERRALQEINLHKSGQTRFLIV
jgi:hypothetical protein